MCVRVNKPLLIKPVTGLKGELALSGDKSIAHRCIILASLSKGKTVLKNFPFNKDCLLTISVFKKLGIKIKEEPLVSQVTVFGKGLYGLKKPKGPVLVGDSGTTLRLILGVLAGQDFVVRLVTGKSLAHRPMLRVTQPLRMMGGIIKSKIKEQKSKKIEEYPPITIKGGKLKSITYKMPVASAQVKSAILLAGLYTPGITRVIEPVRTRDHTERSLKLFKAKIKFKQNKILIKGNQELVSPHNIYIPGDISSGSFFMVLASILSNSRILIRNIGLNPTRAGIIKVLKRMGANIEVVRSPSSVVLYEPMGDILVKSSRLKGTIVKKEEIPTLIDELPILIVAASVAKGKTVLEGVEELRLKETDRIRSCLTNLNRMGAKIKVFKVSGSEQIVIQGAGYLQGCCVRSFADHRTAMSMVAAGLVAAGRTTIDDITCINKSFPNFLTSLKKLIH